MRTGKPADSIRTRGSATTRQHDAGYMAATSLYCRIAISLLHRGRTIDGSRSSTITSKARPRASKRTSPSNPNLLLFAWSPEWGARSTGCALLFMATGIENYLLCRQPCVQFCFHFGNLGGEGFFFPGKLLQLLLVRFQLINVFRPQ